MKNPRIIPTPRPRRRGFLRAPCVKRARAPQLIEACSLTIELAVAVTEDYRKLPIGAGASYENEPKRSQRKVAENLRPGLESGFGRETTRSRVTERTH